MMKKTLYVLVLLSFCVVCNIEARKLSRSRSSGTGRNSGRKQSSNPQPIPTSFSYPQASAPKPSLFGWQEKTSSSRNSKPNSQGHSYPSSNTGLSGNTQPKQPSPKQENIQKSNAPSQFSQVQNSNQQSHMYPASNSMSGNRQSATGGGYPQGTGLSGSNIAPPPYQGTPNHKSQANYPQSSSSGLSGSNGAPPPNQNPYPSNNFGNAYHNPQGPPPPYSSSGNNFYHHPQGPPPPYFGHNNGGFPGHGYNPQTPGYFGNYMNTGRSVGRSGSVLTGVGIAGAGIGTVLTGLALWNLARSTGHHHHTVVYDNRGQPIAVAPDNATAPAIDSILGELVNCSLTISNDNTTEVLAIPCSIATSFTPDANVKDVDIKENTGDTTKCTVTILNKTGKEFMTTIPCSVLLKTAAENNVTEPPVLENTANLKNNTVTPPDVSDDKLYADQPVPLKFDLNSNGTNSVNCIKEPGEIRDPINPCFSVQHNLTVIPLPEAENNNK